MDELKLTKQEEPITLEVQKQETLREHLTSLQNWDVGEGTLEERRAAHGQALIERQQEENAQLAARMQAQLRPVQVQGAAAGQPVQVQAPARRTWKQKREDERRLKEAKAGNPAADLSSYAAVHALQKQQTEKDNSMNMPGLTEQYNANNVDGRVLRCYAQGYRTDKRGRPLTQQDAMRKQADEVFLRDYVSADLQRRRPHLNRMVDELLNAELRADMLDEDYVMQHAAEVKSISDRMVYFQNVYNDPVNAPYFQNMDPLKKKLIKSRILDRYAALGQGMVTVMGAKGVNMDHATYVNGNVRGHRETLQPIRAFFAQQLEQTTQDENAAVEAALQEKLAVERADLLVQSDSMKEQAETAEHLQKVKGLNMTSFVTGYSLDEPAKYREMIENNVERYALHTEVVDRLYQEFYRSMDSMGDLTLEIMACQGVQDGINKMSTELNDRLLLIAAMSRQEEVASRANLIRDQISSIADAMQCLLRGKELTEFGARTLDRLGFHETVISIKQREAAQTPDA